jgi:hypothetical protein
MSATVEKLPNEPIILVTVKGNMTAEIAREVYQEIAQITKDMPLPIYRITDIRKIETNFTDMMEVIKEATIERPGTTCDPRITHIFVGNDKFVKIARDVLQRIDPDNHPMLDTMEKALAYIRWKSEHYSETTDQNVISS